MDKFEINCKLRQIGKTQTQIAHELCVSPALINNVIGNRVSSYKVAIYIAKLLECEVNILWPGRYIFKPRKKE